MAEQEVVETKETLTKSEREVAKRHVTKVSQKEVMDKIAATRPKATELNSYPPQPAKKK